MVLTSVLAMLCLLGSVGAFMPSPVRWNIPSNSPPPSSFAPSFQSKCQNPKSFVRSSLAAIPSVGIQGSLHPFSNNVVVKVKEPKSMTSGGIILPDNNKVRPTEGVVVAAGSGKIHSETGVLMGMAVSVGDGVIYGKYDGTEVVLNGANHQIIKDDDVLLKYSSSNANDEPLFESVQPVKDYVLIRPPAREDVKVGGGVIVSTAASEKDKRVEQGVVVKVGPGRQASGGAVIPMQAVVGDRVRFRGYSATEVKIEGTEYLVVRESDLLAKW